MSAVKFTAATDNGPQYIFPQNVASVRLTRGDPNTPSSGPQGTLICTTSAPPDNRIVVVEAIDTVIQELNAALLLVLQR